MQRNEPAHAKEIVISGRAGSAATSTASIQIPSASASWTGKETGDQYHKALRGKEIGFFLGKGSRPGETGKVAKLYAVTKFEPWDWIVGYGAYVDDINNAFWRRADTFLLIGLILIGVVATLALRMSQKILSQLGGEPQYASDIALGIAKGNLSHPIAVSGHASSLLGSMNTMQTGLRSMVSLGVDLTEKAAAANFKI